MFYAYFLIFGLWSMVFVPREAVEHKKITIFVD